MFRHTTVSFQLCSAFRQAYGKIKYTKFLFAKQSERLAKDPYLPLEPRVTLLCENR